MAKRVHRRHDKQESREALAFILEAVNQAAAQYMASPWLPVFVAQKFQWHALFVQTVESAASIVKRNIKPDLFNSYLILASRWFSHHEAVEMLLPRAGTATAWFS